MTFTLALALAVASSPGLVLWADPERTLRVDPSRLPNDLQSLARSAGSDHHGLLRRLEANPEDWRVHMIVRAEIARSRDAGLAKLALAKAQKSLLQYGQRTPHWYRRELLYGGLAHACYRLAERGGLSADQALRNEWQREGQHALIVRVSDLKSVEEAYLPLSVYWSIFTLTNEARTFLAQCRSRFGPDAGLDVYTARLYDVAVAEGWTFPSDGRPAYRNKAIAARSDPGRVRDAVLQTWRARPDDPGVLALAAGYLRKFGDPRAERAYAAYRAAGDPEKDRVAKIKEIWGRPVPLRP